MQLSRSHATLIGCIAPICWGMSVPFVRLVSEHIGQPGGMILLCGLACVILACIFGCPRLSHFSGKYLFFGLTTAVACEICFTWALALSGGGTQTAEAGMVNYLWPCLTMVFAVIFNGQKAKWWIVFGFISCIYGVCTVLSGPGGFDFMAMARNMESNPACYLFALGSALSWASYSSITRALSHGANPVVLIFFINTCVFIAMAAAGVGEPMHIDLEGGVVVAVAAVVMGLAYALWTIGMMNGNMTVLAVVSYFTPVLSCIFCWMFLGAELSANFWKGVGFVVAGSLICWASTVFAKPKA